MRTTAPLSHPQPKSRIDRDAEALHRALSALVRIYQSRDRDQICCHDVSVTQCYALETLVEHGPMRLGALAERLFLDKSTASRVVSALVRKGYAEQGPDPSDGRATTISATRPGQRLCRRITDGLVAQQKALVDDLDPRMRAGVIEVLQRLAAMADARFRSRNTLGPGCCTLTTDSPVCD